MSFHPVYVSMYDRNFSQLSVFAQVVEFYLRTGPQRASEGLFRFNPAMAAHDLGITTEDVEIAMKELEEAKRPFLYDIEAGVVFDQTALRDNPLGKRDADWNEGPRDRRIKGAISKFKSLPPTPLLKQLYVIAGLYSPQLAEAMNDSFPDLTKPLEAPSRPMKPREEKSREEERRVGGLRAVD